MITLEELNTKVNQIKSSTETSETLLAEILDLMKVIEKNHSPQSNDLQLEVLNKIHEQITQIKKQSDGKENTEVLFKIENIKTDLEQLINQKSFNQITVFGGHNAVVKYYLIMIGIGVIVLAKFGADYFIEKQKQDQDFLKYKTYTETVKMMEFKNTKDTKEYDNLIRAIVNKDEGFNKYYKNLKENWDKEHEKAELAKKIKEDQERLKQLK